MPHQGDSLGAAIDCDTSATLPSSRKLPRSSGSGTPTVMALAIVWARTDLETLGSLFVLPQNVPGLEFTIGREASGPRGDRQLQLTRQRPGVILASPPITSRHISRAQLGVRVLDGENFEIRRLGQCPVFHNGVELETARLAVGDVLEFGDRLMLVAVRRPAWLAASESDCETFPFGAADEDGIVGESAQAWDLRQQIAFVAPKDVNTLIVGPSGTGKELVAQSLHNRSQRASRPLIARSAATFPEGLVDAELFGNMRGYPNAGMLERQGLVGEADGSTLYLDEIGELPPALQSHLLRVLDKGEYHRLGESRSRLSNFRLIAATNRSPEELKTDFLARMPCRIKVPSLNERREDIPFLCLAILQRLGTNSPDIAARFFDQSDLRPRISPLLMRKLLRHNYSTNVRELEALLWQAIIGSVGNEIGDTHDATLGEQSSAPFEQTIPPAAIRATEPLDVELLQKVLDEHQGNIELSRQALGLASRHVLARLIAKHGLRAGRSWAVSDQ